MSHNNYTHNNNNTYTIEIAIDPSSAGGTGTTISYDDTGTVYYKMDIIPNTIGTPLFAGNFTIDGVSPTYHWSWNTNPIGPTNQSAPIPPHSYYTTQQIQKTLIGQYGPLYPLDNNPIYGPIKFDNSAYVNGGFTTSGKRATWSKIILKEVYYDNNGVEYTANGQNESASSSESTWILNPLPNLNLFNSDTELPYKIVAYVYMEYNFSVLLSNETLNIDFDQTPPVGGCTDQLADNFNGQVHFDDGSCTYSSQQYSITFNGPSGNATGPYTNAFTSSQFANLNPNYIRNFIFNGGVPLVLNNTYAAGDLVSELVTINLTPVNLTVTGNIEAVYDFPNLGGPNANLDNTDPDVGFGDSTNNLTAASIRFLNLDNYDSSSQTPNYLSIGAPGVISGTSSRPSWVADVWSDSTGATPSTIVYFNFLNGIDTFDDNGNSITLDTDTIQIEEFYYANSNPQLILNPGYEWYPYKLTLSIVFDFHMPAHDLNIVLDLDHNTENQGGGNI